MDILEVAKRNQQRAWEVIMDTDIIRIWEGIGAEVNLVGSLSTGLLMRHRDIDFHIYSFPLEISDSFRAMSELAENPSIKKIECVNLLHTVEACVEWHAWYRDADNALWQIDMIHILEGSRYDGYFEKFAERLSGLVREVRGNKRICGFCVTQVTDVEAEVNGLCDSERKAKLEKDVVARAIRQ